MIATRNTGKELPAIYTTIGENLAHIRKELGITQAELASKLNTSQQLIASYEAGTRRIHLQTLIAIAEILHVSVVDLLSQTEQYKKPGPRPKIALSFEKLISLPEKDRALVISMIESLATARKTNR
jgi:transcriptional regulator with XRE-family HTH domain